MKAFTKNSTTSEVLGLQELKRTGFIRIPEILSFEKNSLSLSWINKSEPTEKYWTRLGTHLAKLHQVTKNYFGWEQNGFIGPTPQINIKTDRWADFFIKHRLDYQMSLLSKKDFFDPILSDSYRKNEKRIRMILNEVTEPACILHGDLWQGNVMCDSEQYPIFIDPAVYYGHRETDLAMMKLFGGFDEKVFEVYYRDFPLQMDWEIREKIYQLYHILNHANLFSSNYMWQAYEILDHLFR